MARLRPAIVAETKSQFCRRRKHRLRNPLWPSWTVGTRLPAAWNLLLQTLSRVCWMWTRFCRSDRRHLVAAWVGYQLEVCLRAALSRFRSVEDPELQSPTAAFQPQPSLARV